MWLAPTKLAVRCRVYAFTDAAGKTKPGMVRVLDGEPGKDFYLELWDVPVEKFGRFMLQVRYFAAALALPPRRMWRH